MDLDEFAIRVIASLLIKRRLCRTGADHGVGALAENCANASGRHNDGIGRERAHLHRTQVHGANSAADALRVENGRKKFPRFVFGYLTLGLVTPDLLIERIKKLLAS